MTIVRRAEPADFPAVADLTVAAYRAAGQLDDAAGYAAVLADAAHRAASAELLVAVDDAGRVRGAVTFCRPGQPYAEMARPGEAEFRMLAVDPAAQGQGIGESLARECIARATAIGCTALVLCTREDAVAGAARRLYDRLGFVRDPALDWSPMPGITLDAWRLPLPVSTTRTT